jgi:hypothetical protein
MCKFHPANNKLGFSPDDTEDGENDYPMEWGTDSAAVADEEEGEHEEVVYGPAAPARRPGGTGGRKAGREASKKAKGSDEHRSGLKGKGRHAEATTPKGKKGIKEASHGDDDQPKRKPKKGATDKTKAPWAAAAASGKKRKLKAEPAGPPGSEDDDEESTSEQESDSTESEAPPSPPRRKARKKSADKQQTEESEVEVRGKKPIKHNKEEVGGHKTFKEAAKGSKHSKDEHHAKRRRK